MSTRSLRVLIASGLFLGMSAIFSSTAFAETFTTNNAEVRNITVTPATLNLSTTALGAAVTDGSIGTVKVQSNTGFKVTVSSTNSGKFSDGTNDIPYTLKYDGTTPSSGLAETSASMVAACNTANGCDRALTVDIAAGARYTIPAGNYTDTLTFSIAAP